MTIKKDDNSIPRRNYLIFCLLVVIVVVLTLVLCNFYGIRQNLMKENSIMSEFLVSVNEEEFENYIIENNNVIIYLASSKDDTLNNFENDFKQIIIDYSLQSQIIFVDFEQINDAFFASLKNNYFSEKIGNIEIGKFPNLLIMENGKINAVLYTNSSIINVDDVKEFLYSRGVIGQV